jgi:hypothetical protein
MTEGAKQRQPEYEVELDIATNNGISFARHNYGRAISATEMWTAALMDPLHPY